VAAVLHQSRGPARAPLARIDELLRDRAARREIAGAVGLIAHGDMVHVATAGVQDLASAVPMRRDTIFRIASMTKPVVAAAAMMLVDQGRIALDDAVERWLPELADRRVLRGIERPLDDTVPAARPITLRDLMTFTFGLGAVMAKPGSFPIQSAMSELGVAPGPEQVAMPPDEYMRRIGTLPLMHQPGERWMYHTGADVLAVLIARIAGKPLDGVLHERILAPLGMCDTGFHVPEQALDRLATCYARDDAGALQIWDPAHGGRYARPPAFPSLLASTADDFLAFARMLLRDGAHAGQRLLAPKSAALMMTDQLTAEQKAASPFFPGFWDTKGWGFGGAVVTRRDPTGAHPGSYGWAGGFGTNFIVDPAADLVAILLVQRLMRGPNDMALNEEFLTLAAQAIEH
jgi:CubicO group peptidase (beta-lactamase class C family)